MKKICLLLLALLLFASYTQAQSQNDFYGKWVKEDDKIRLEYIFDKTHLITITTQLDPNWAFFFQPERVVWEISSWELVRNNDRSDYSNGVKIGVRGVNSLDVATFYISRDKNSIKKSSDMENAYYRETYIQELKKDILGTWARTDNSWSFTFTDKKYIEKEKLYDISSWRIISNKDDSTKTDYPTGFLVRIDGIIINGKSYYEEEEYYLHKNKESLVKISKISIPDFTKSSVIFFSKIK